MLFLSRSSMYFRAVCALVLVLLPLVLGGGGDPVVNALVACAAGLFCIAVPAGARLDGLWLAIFACLAALPLLALLPLGGLAGGSTWRMATGGMGVSFPFITPQPRALLETLPLYYAGLAFAGWIIRADWDSPERRFLAVALEWGFASVLCLALLNHFLQISPPFWNPVSGFGPFSSRNQSGLLFAIGFVWSLPLATEAFSAKRWATAAAWFALGGAFVFTAFINGSRAGFGFCVFGVILYLGLAGFASRKPALMILAGLLLIGGLLLVALYNYDPAMFSWLDPVFRRDGMVRAFRLKVHQDTWDLIREFPVTGIGLGNYDAVFSFYRSRSAMDYRVLHAESDWLHFAAECGGPALLVAAIAILRMAGWAGREAFARDRSRFMRGGLVVLALTVSHGFFDQSLHSAGIILPVLLVVSLSLRPAPVLRTLPRIGWQGVATGVAVLMLGLMSARWAESVRLAGTVLDGSRLSGPPNMSLRAVDAALDYAPLAWNLHEMRGHLLLAAGKDSEALTEFRSARLLEPFNLGLALRESNAWIDAGKLPLSVEAAKQAVLRVTPASRQSAIYQEYLGRYSPFPDVRKQWLAWAPSSSEEFTVARIPFLSPEEAGAALDGLVAGGSHGEPLSGYAGRRLVVMEMQRGGAARLEALRRAGFRFPDQVWIGAAQELAAQSHVPEACEIVIARLDPVPAGATRPKLDEAEREYFSSPLDPRRALSLARVYLGEGSAMAAGRVIDHLPTASRDSVTVDFYRGWIAHLEGDDVLAWACFKKYIARNHPALP